MNRYGYTIQKSASFGVSRTLVILFSKYRIVRIRSNSSTSTSFMPHWRHSKTRTMQINIIKLLLQSIVIFLCVVTYTTVYHQYLLYGLVGLLRKKKAAQKVVFAKGINFNIVLWRRHIRHDQTVRQAVEYCTIYLNPPLCCLLYCITASFYLHKVL